LMGFEIDDGQLALDLPPGNYGNTKMLASGSASNAEIST
jgi:hypothetical protein